MTKRKPKKPRAPRGTYSKPGHPTDYKPEYAAQAEKLCLMGATDMELADFFGVTWRTIYRWKNTQPKFAAAMKEGKDAADARVVRSLYQRAIGYEHDAVKIFLPRNSRNAVMVPYVEHVPPDVGAGLFWLKNRQPDQWRDKSNVAIGGDPNAPPVEVGTSALEELFSRITSLTATSGKAGASKPDDGSAGS